VTHRGASKVPQESILSNQRLYVVSYQAKSIRVTNFVPPLLHRKSMPNSTLLDGMVIAIEPMVHIGSKTIEVLKDGWTVVTKDRKKAAHFEHTVMIDGNKAVIFTLRS
jgi:methionine aminopeptidase